LRDKPVLATSLTKNPRRERGFFSPLWPRVSPLDTADFHRSVRHSIRHIFVELLAPRPPASHCAFRHFRALAKFTNRTISGHF
jgi:hypothetical protein